MPNFFSLLILNLNTIAGSLSNRWRFPSAFYSGWENDHSFCLYKFHGELFPRYSSSMFAMTINWRLGKLALAGQSDKMVVDYFHCTCWQIPEAFNSTKWGIRKSWAQHKCPTQYRCRNLQVEETLWWGAACWFWLCSHIPYRKVTSLKSAFESWKQPQWCKTLISNASRA